MGQKRKYLLMNWVLKSLDIDSFVGEYINKGSDKNTEMKFFIDLFYPELAEKKQYQKETEIRR